MDLYLLLKVVVALGAALALISIGSAAITLSRAPSHNAVGLVVDVPGRPHQVMSLALDDPVLAELENAHPGLKLRPPAMPTPSANGNHQIAWGRIAIFATLASAGGVSATLPEIGAFLRLVIPLGAAGVTTLGELVGAVSNHRSEGKSRTESLSEATGTLREIFDFSKARR